MNKTTFLTLITILFFSTVKSQVLYSENFDSYTVGNLGTDGSGTIPGQDNWYTMGITVKNDNFRIEAEKGRGNVLVLQSYIEERGKSAKVYRQAFKNVGNIWNNRDINNNILKIEFEFQYFLNSQYTEELIFLDLTDDKSNGMTYGFCAESKNNNEIFGTWSVQGYNFTPSLIADQKVWQKMILYYDIDNKYIYGELPSKNHTVKVNRSNFVDDPLEDNSILRIGLLAIDNFYKQVYFKIDNLVISAVNTLPKLNTIDLSPSKFKLYPNPATKFVSITNSENLFFKQIQLFDMTGKLILTQDFENQSEIQLNVEALTTGTYQLHIHTNEGTAMKQLIKK